jgi:hypothetical protein
MGVLVGGYGEAEGERYMSNKKCLFFMGVVGPSFFYEAAFVKLGSVLVF